MKHRILALIILLLTVFAGYSILQSERAETGFLKNNPFRLGLDLSGGSYLLYKADISTLPENQINDSMDALRDVIERRVNLFGVGEPIVQVQTSNFSGEKEHRLSVELPGVTDISKAIEMIGQTPFLEFKTQIEAAPASPDAEPMIMFASTPLTGKYLERAALEFNPGTQQPIISLQFNKEGAVLFEQITAANVGKPVAIFLDGGLLSAPIVQEPISGGVAQISGTFTPQEGKELVGRLNSGALPVPISLISTQTIGATLGADAVQDGIRAAVIGFIAIAVLLIAWYRLPGVVAVLALGAYIVLTLLVYKLIPVTLTAAGIAGFIISIGMAVDANILIFERFSEERLKGGKISDALNTGFSRAWFSIRDANSATFITSVILFWFGSSLIKGFALTLGLGVIISLISAIIITKIFLRALPTMERSRLGRFLFSNGFKK